MPNIAPVICCRPILELLKESADEPEEEMDEGNWNRLREMEAFDWMLSILID